MKSKHIISIFTTFMYIASAGFPNCAHGRLRSITTSHPAGTAILSWERPVGVQCGKFIGPICFCFDPGVFLPLYTEPLVPSLPMMDFAAFDYAMGANGKKNSTYNPALETKWHISWFDWGRDGRPSEIVVEAMEGGRLSTFTFGTTDFNCRFQNGTNECTWQSKGFPVG